MPKIGTSAPKKGAFALMVVAALVLAGCSDSGDSGFLGQGSSNSCQDQCRSMRASCLIEAGRDRDAGISACAGASSCRADVERIHGAAREVCASADAQCGGCCAAAGTQCAAVAPEVPKFSGSFTLPARTSLRTMDLPTGAAGRGKLLLDLPEAQLIVDPDKRTPVTAAAECATAVLSCYEKDRRNWAGCFASVPTCPTSTPWTSDGPMCCPAACASRYQELRRAGHPGYRAMSAAIWAAPSCMPGLQGAAMRTAP